MANTDEQIRALIESGQLVVPEGMPLPEPPPPPPYEATGESGMSPDEAQAYQKWAQAKLKASAEEDRGEMLTQQGPFPQDILAAAGQAPDFDPTEQSRATEAAEAYDRKAFDAGTGDYAGMPYDPAAGAAPPSMPAPLQTGPQDYWNQQVQPPDPLEDVAAQAEDFQNQAYQMEMARATTLDDKAAETRASGKKIAAQSQIAQALKTRGLDEMEGFSKDLEDAYLQADMDLASMRVDPNKWEKETPVLSKVLLTIAAGISGYTSGGRGANPIVGLIERSIDRDVAAQEKNIMLRLKRSKNKVDFTERMGQVRTALYAGYYERAESVVQAIAQNSKTELSALNAQALGQGIRSKAMLAKAAYYHTTLETAMKYRAAEAKANAPGKTTSDFVEKQSSNVGTIEAGARLIGQLDDLKKQNKGLGRVESSKIAQLFGMDPGATEDELVAYARQLGRALGTDKGNFAEKEGEVMVRALLGGKWDRAERARRNISKQLNILAKNWNATYEGHKASNRHRELEPSYKRLTKIMSFVNRGKKK